MIFDFTAWLDHAAEWQSEAFGDGPRVKGLVDHMRKEIAEIEAKPEDPMEYIDLIFLAVDGLRRIGYTAYGITKLLEEKLEINQDRTWPDHRTADPTRAIEHMRDVAHDERVRSTDELVLATRVAASAYPVDWAHPAIKQGVSVTQLDDDGWDDPTQLGRAGAAEEDLSEQIDFTLTIPGWEAARERERFLRGADERRRLIGDLTALGTREIDSDEGTVTIQTWDGTIIHEYQVRRKI